MSDVLVGILLFLVACALCIFNSILEDVVFEQPADPIGEVIGSEVIGSEGGIQLGAGSQGEGSGS